MKRPLAIAALILLCVTLAAPAQQKKGKGKEQPKGPAPIKVLLITGGCCHDYPAQVHILRDGLTARANVQVDFTLQGGSTSDTAITLYNSPDWYKGYDVIIHDECFAFVKDKQFVDNILAPHRAGLPSVTLHCAMHCYRVDFDTYKDWFNFVGVESHAHGPKKPIAISFTDSQNPIVKGMANWTTIDEELYNNIALIPTAHELARGKQDQPDKAGKVTAADWMVVWTNEFGPNKTRVFSTTLGHQNETVADARYLDLVTRGLLWATNHLNDDGTPAAGYGPAGK